METLCISLQKETNKRQHISSQAENIGLQDIKFIDAIHWKSLPELQIQQMAKQWTNSKRSLDIACLLSHRECWKIIAESQRPMLIIEDDVVMSANLPRILFEIELRMKNAGRYECYNLEYGPRKHFIQKIPEWSAKLNCDNPSCEHSDTNTQIIEARQLYHKKNGAAGYVLNPDSASRLHQLTENKFCTVEWLFYRPWLHLYVVEPTPIAQLYAIDCSKHAEMIARSVETDTGPFVGPNKWSIMAKLRRIRLTMDHLPNLAQGVRMGTYRNLTTDLISQGDG